jgi:hypothetical protein
VRTKTARYISFTVPRPLSTLLDPTYYTPMALSKAFVLAISAALVTLAVGQDNANVTVTLGIEAIQANFQQAAISGDGNLVPNFDPSALLTVSFPSAGE